MRLVVRRWEGLDWPENRVSIADADAGHALFISARYADVDEAYKQAEEICKAYNEQHKDSQ